MIMGRQNQFPNRSIISYRSGSCLLAAKIIRKYKKKNFLIGKDSTQHLVRLHFCFYNVHGYWKRKKIETNLSFQILNLYFNYL